MSKKKIIGRISVFIVLAGILGIVIVWRSFFSPVKTSEEGIDIYIANDAAYEDVKDSLRTKGIMVNERAFDILAKRKKYITNVKAGRFLIAERMSYNDIVNLLRSGNQTPVRITFNNIRTLQDLAQRLSTQIAADSASIYECFINEADYQKKGFTKEDIISVFIPDTYEVYWTISPENLLSRMIREFAAFWNQERTQSAKALGLSPVEVSILASIVDDEVLKEDEKPIIAGVYMNRLHRKMPMQACPTIKFALNDFTIRRVLKEHLTVESPYNTYKYRGLPPGPVRCASKSGINAVLNAEDHNYLYFVARYDFSGYHHFSTNLKEHTNYANKYQSELNKKKIYN